MPTARLPVRNTVFLPPAFPFLLLRSTSTVSLIVRLHRARGLYRTVFGDSGFFFVCFEPCKSIRRIRWSLVDANTVGDRRSLTVKCLVSGDEGISVSGEKISIALHGV